MKIGFFQYDVFWRDRDGNLAYIQSKLAKASFDLLVLPELFTLGYAANSREDVLPFAEDLKQSHTVNYLRDIMRDHQAFITGTIPEISGANLYNTAILVGPDGLVASYRKIHLTDYEKRIYQPGNEVISGSCKETNVGLSICFDAWFAALSSKLKTQDAHIITNSSCFGGEVTPTLFPIRALENQCFVINCNRIGTEYFDGEPESYRGESQIVSPDGKVLFKADNKESLTILDVDLAEVNNPAFGSQILSNFPEQHARYGISVDKA